MNRKDILRRARGQWKSILLKFDFDSSFLTGKHGPCPWCGGKDRWRFSDWKSDGWGFCNQCDGTGDGLKILSKHLGMTAPRDLPRLIKKVDEVLP